MRLMVVSSGGTAPTHLTMSDVLVAKTVPELTTLCGSRLKVSSNTRMAQSGHVSCVPCISKWREEHPSDDGA